MKRMFVPMAMLVCAGAFVGCQSLTEPETALNDQTLVSDFDVTTQADQISLLEAAGADVDSANGFFLLNWNEMKQRQTSDAQVIGRATAVSFGSTLSVPRSKTPGVDMGEVTLAIHADVFALPKITFPNDGVRYGLVGFRGGPPHGGPRGEHGGPHGRSGEPGGKAGQPPFGVDSLNIPFVSSGVYQFAASGSEQVPALTLDIQAPAQLLQIGGVTDDQIIDVTQDLTITWTGDASVSEMTLVLAPAFHRGRFDGMNQRPEPLMITLDPAAGSYTISAQTLQDVLGDANGLMLHVAQGTHREVALDNGTKYVIGLRTSDGVRLRIN